MKQMTIVGNIGRDASIKEINGNRMVEFTVAVNEKYKKSDGTQVETTDWIGVLYHNEKIAQHLKSGMKVLVQGGFSIRTYQGTQDKKWKSGVSIRATMIEFLGGGKREETGNTNTIDEQPAPVLADGQPADDLPF
jgi:single-strand DNA-binding protein